MKKGKIYLIRERDVFPYTGQEVVVSYIARLVKKKQFTYELTVLAKNPHPDNAPRLRGHDQDEEVTPLVITDYELEGGDMLVTEVDPGDLPLYMDWWKSPEFDKALKHKR